MNTPQGNVVMNYNGLYMIGQLPQLADALTFSCYHMMSTTLPPRSLRSSISLSISASFVETLCMRNPPLSPFMEVEGHRACDLAS